MTSKANAFDFIIKGLSDIAHTSSFDFIPLYHKTHYFSTYIIKNAFRLGDLPELRPRRFLARCKGF
jgi:hypothetical protein